jgi:hypothetical protein
MADPRDRRRNHFQHAVGLWLALNAGMLARPWGPAWHQAPKAVLCLSAFFALSRETRFRGR